jgi:hypothetical protein
LPDLVDTDTIDQVARRVVTAVSLIRPLGANDATRVGTSVGVGRLGGAASFADALREADADPYRRKSEHHALLRAQAASLPLPLAERRVKP